MTYKDNFLYCALNQNGVSKWLLCPPKNNPEQKELTSNLIKILPVVQGFNISRVLFGREKQLLVGLGAPLMLRFDVTSGYTGYFESHNNSTVVDITAIGDTFVALAGKAKVDKTELGKESNEKSIIDASDSVCIEIVNLQTNSLVCKLI